MAINPKCYNWITQRTLALTSNIILTLALGVITLLVIYAPEYMKAYSLYARGSDFYALFKLNNTLAVIYNIGIAIGITKKSAIFLILCLLFYCITWYISLCAELFALSKHTTSSSESSHPSSHEDYKYIFIEGWLHFWVNAMWLFFMGLIFYYWKKISLFQDFPDFMDYVVEDIRRNEEVEVAVIRDSEQIL